ncbi:outer membrane beta-barrel protein [Aureibacter tunicatorum]|uniref:Outer membrane protein beta-barrel domain-containing protein n=1 Tax=Aureibacter tunicatorum TaxID=866807 RepID=A0AAE3XNE4_9BACT|nr:outer membrane beta-barrel protein [Aureibacter tunicatorum]MDR6238264.1 hypothetical protein [Aureibacter tunicatorum]BDD03297.1 hypothetical protein AUTU_07800 [Aureibacter tunicatorum]
MKKLFLLAAGLFLSATSFAQIEKGKVSLGGTVGFSISESSMINYDYYMDEVSTEKTQLFQLLPSFGYFVSDNVSLGVTTGVMFEKSSQKGSEVEYKDRIIAFGPTVRYYKMINENFGFFGQGQFLYTSTQSWASNINASGHDSDKLKINGLRIGITPGITYFVSKSVALEASYGFFGYTQSKVKDEEDIKDTEFGLNLDTSSLTFGFQFYF